MGNQNIKGPYGTDWPREDVLAGVGKGWGKLVGELIDDLFKLGWDGELHQIKEKFGGLRFYIGGGTDEVWDRIHEAEEASLRVCEDCGAPGSTTNHGWIRTLCDTHKAITREANFVADDKHRAQEGTSERGSVPPGELPDPDGVVSE